MPDNAQLIFIAGPEEGRVATLDKPSVLMGRSPSAALKLMEQYASREHAEFTTGADGVEVEVLSDRGLEVAGKTYKKGKRLLLASGDILKIGMQTELVFVAGGDDPASVLAGAKAARVAKTTARQRAEEQKQARREAREQEKKARKASKVEEPAAEQEEPAEKVLTPGGLEAAEQRRRRKRLMVGLSIWLGLMFIAFIGLSLFKKGKTGPTDYRPEALTLEQIRQAVQQVEGDFGFNEPEALKWLAQAHQNYATRTLPGSRYQTVRCYNLYMRWSVKDRLDNPDDMRKYNEVFDELVQQIREAYDRGYGAITYERWGEAQAAFESVRQMVPETKNLIFENAGRHLNYINQRQDAAKRSGGRSPGGSLRR